MNIWRLAIVFGVLCASASAAVPVPRVKPDAPLSPWISREDATQLRAVFEALDDGRYETADVLSASIGLPLAATIAEWAMLHSKNPGLPLQRYDAFLDTHPSWPSEITIRRRAESRITDETSPEAIIAFFDTREPLSGFGKLHLGRALIALGREDLGGAYVRKAWIEHNFNRNDSRDIIITYGAYLRPDDHFAKADRALFRRTTAGTEDVEGLLTPRRAKEVEARKNLLRGRTSGRTQFNRLPQESQRDPGVLHAMMRYLRRANREEEAITLSTLAPVNPDALRDPGAWYYERKLLARWALKNGRFEDAYALSAYAGVTEGSDFAEAEFFSGWLALRFLGDADRAMAHFDFLTSQVTSPISLARGNYWQARAASAAGDEERARAHYMVAADYPYTYYGQLAIETLGQAAPQFAFPDPARPTDKDRAALTDRALIRAMLILDYIDQDLTFRRFAMTVDDQLTEAEEVLAYANLVRDTGHFDLIVRGGKASRKTGAAVPQVIYPMYPVPAEAAAFVETPLVLGLSRQESEFRVDAYSSARAKGMMQLLDSTAKITARKEGLPYVPGRLLSDPAYNMTLGAAHLSHLLDRFDGSYIMVLAAYNAGPHRVDQWVEAYGDPRSPDVDPVDWVELIPFSETRNYVMRVLENVQVYRSQIGDFPLGAQLTEDLTRGSPSTIATIGKPVPLPTLWDIASEAGPPLIDDEALGALPLALVRAENLARGAPFNPLLSPSDPPGSASNR